MKNKRKVAVLSSSPVKSETESIGIKIDVNNLSTHELLDNLMCSAYYQKSYFGGFEEWRESDIIQQDIKRIESRLQPKAEPTVEGEKWILDEVNACIFKGDDVLRFESFEPYFPPDKNKLIKLQSIAALLNRAPSGEETKEEISPRVAKLILGIRDALALDNEKEAYHLLYQITSPKFDKTTELWKDVEAIARRSPDKNVGKGCPCKESPNCDCTVAGFQSI